MDEDRELLEVPVPEESQFTHKDALSRALINAGTALPKTPSPLRTHLAHLHQRVDAMMPTDTAAIARFGLELMQLIMKLR
jgi:hypothetical protein